MSSVSTLPGKPSRGPFSLVLRNVTSSWAVLLVNTIISFVLAPLVVRHLGSVYYGVWSLLMQFTGYLWLFDFGVRESVIKYVAQYRASGEHQKLESTVRTAISVYAVIALLALAAVGLMVGVLPFVFNIPPDAVRTARIAAFVTGANVAQSFLTNVFVGMLMGLQRIYLVSQVGVLFSVVRAVGTYLLLVNGYGIVGLSLLHLALSLSNASLVVWLCHVHLPEVPLRPIRPTREEVTKLFNYGKYVLLANIGDKFVFATDALVIGMFLPIASLTPYAIAGTLIGHMRSVVMAMASIFNPLTSHLRAGGDETALQIVLRSGAKAAMTVGLPLCIGFIMLGERFVMLWMGPTHAPMASRVMMALAAGYIIGLPYYTISGILYGLGAHRTVAILRIVEGAMNLVLSVTLVNTIGLIGVAIGTAIPHMIVVGWVLPRALPNIFPVDLREYYRTVYGRTLLAAVPFALVCWTIRDIVQPPNLPSFFLWGLASLVTYVVPVWLITLTDDERRHLSGMARIAPRASVKKPLEKLS
jgi:O-antigen/teichoic acid export membrane protein